jgi:integrase
MGAFMAVRKRVWTTRRGEQKEAWIVDYAVNGSRHIETFERKKEADAREAEVTVNVGKGIHIAPSKTPTVREAGKLWLEGCSHIERATALTYRQHLHLHINPYLGHFRLAHLTPPAIRQFEDDLRAGKAAPFPPDEKPHDRFKQKRSPAMVKKVVTTLGNMLADMQERGLVAVNAVHSLSKGRKHKRKSKREQEAKLNSGVDFPTPKEITAIIANLSDRWRPMILTAIFTGLRASELRGLRWGNVDLPAAKLHVKERADRFLEIGKPKSEAGERTVPLPPMLVNTLREYKLKTKFKADEDFVFPTDKGNAQHYANVLHRGLEPAQIDAKVMDKKTGKPKYALHALRHFYASWCINRPKEGGLGLSPKIVQARMGHSSITITMDRYGHLFPSDDDGREMKLAEKGLMPVS